MSSAIIGATAPQLLSGMEIGRLDGGLRHDRFSRPDPESRRSDQGLSARDRADAIRQAEAIDRKRRQGQSLARLAVFQSP